MAFVDDSFESYSVGATPPFGVWTSPNPVTCVITTGGMNTGVGTSSRSLQITNGSLVYDSNPSFKTSASVFMSFFADTTKIQNGESIPMFKFTNGPNGFGSFFDLMTVQMENDTTISCYHNLDLIGNSIDAQAHLRTWNFIQINLTVSDTVVSSSTQVHIVTEIGLNGTSILSKSFDTGQAVSSLLGTTAQFNIFNLTSTLLQYDNVTFDTLQAIMAHPHPGTPHARASQGVAELPILPSSALVDAFQGVAELPLLPSTAKVNAYQGVIELILSNLVRWRVYEA